MISSKAVLLLWAASAIACNGPFIYEQSIHRGLVPPAYAPRTKCEREGRYELAPAQMRAREADGTNSPNSQYWPGLLNRARSSVLAHGTAVFDAGSNDPEELDDI